MIGAQHVNTTILSAGAGLLLAVVYSASPLTVCVVVLSSIFCAHAGRGLPAPERRALIVILVVALSARLIYVAALSVIGIPSHNDLSVGALTGDESYYLSRALRARDIALGVVTTKYDYFVATDDYGRTSYLGLLTGIQLWFGPTPYSMRLLNALFFAIGATVLFRIARRAFGPLPAFVGLVTLLFVPSLFVASVSLLKESLYFLVSTLLLACALGAVRSETIGRRVIAVAAGAACLWALNDLRRGALVLAIAGLALGFALRLVAVSRWRTIAAGAALAASLAVVVSTPTLRTRVVDAITSTAKTHAGNVFTVGHAYKLMDPGFYMTPENPSVWDVKLTEPQAARFVLRAAASFLLTPLPWEMRSIGELAFMPEHMLWYVVLLFLPAGIAAGWKRDSLVTAVILGYALPTAAAIALTNGNVGTLLRLRGLVTPYLLWLSALGIVAAANHLAASRPADAFFPARREAAPYGEGPAI
jgi:hypothetical protein